MQNALSNAADLPFSKEQIQSVLTELGLPVTIRGEALTLEQFADFTNLLAKRSESQHILLQSNAGCG